MTETPVVPRVGRKTVQQSILFDAPGPKARRLYAILTVIGAVLILATLGVVLAKLGSAGQLDPALWMPFVTPDAWLYYLIPGIIGTVEATILSVLLAGLYGVLFGAGRLSTNPWLRRICGIVVEVFRSVPVLIMMIFVATILSQGGWFPSEINPLIAVVTALTVYNGSVIAELVRSGVHSLPKGQREAGLAIGLTPGQVLRQIQLPQALVAMLPALIGQLVVVLKDTALGYGILYSELLNWSKTLGSAYGNTVPAYIVAAILFIIMNYLVTRLAAYVEKRLRRSAQTAAPVTTAAPNIIQGTAEPGSSAAAGLEGLKDAIEDLGHPTRDAHKDA